MYISLALPDGDFNKLGKQIIDKAIMTKGMWLIAIMEFLILAFILSYSKIPYINKNITLTAQDLRIGFYLSLFLATVFGFLYALPEFKERWFKGKDIK